MDYSNIFRFSDLPAEIQQIILRKCLEGWKATVETHEKADNKSTTRLWSSTAYDALMLSLTCKSFHTTIQKIQRDPRLFSGEIDLIESNAELAYLVGYFVKPIKEDDYSSRVRSTPYPLYRTQIFIKTKPYDRSKARWRKRRIAYHAEARHWLIGHTRSLGLWADEVKETISWSMFPVLEHVKIYWPYVAFDVINPTQLVCQHNKQDLVKMAHKMSNTYEDFSFYTVRASIAVLQQRGIRVTLQYDVAHSHDLGHDIREEGWDGSIVRAEGPSDFYYKLECELTSNEDGSEWILDRAVCHAAPLRYKDTDEVSALMLELITSDHWLEGDDQGNGVYYRPLTPDVGYNH